MKKQQIIPIHLILAAIWTWILMKNVMMYKTAVYFINANPYYDATFWVLYFLTLIYAHFFVTRNILVNLVITSILFQVCSLIGCKLVEFYMGYLDYVDKGKTPYGWTFKYRFLDIPVVSVLLLLAFEVVRKVIPVKWRIV